MRIRHLSAFAALLGLACGDDTSSSGATGAGAGTVTSGSTASSSSTTSSTGSGGAGVGGAGGAGGASTHPDVVCPAYAAKAMSCFPGANEDFLAECYDLYELCGGAMPAVVACRIETPCQDLAQCMGLAC